MDIFLTILLLLILFIIMGFAGDITVKNLKLISNQLGLSLFVIGIILGITTSLPEFFLALNATVEKTPVISVGNLMGGVVVLIGLILGLSLIVNRSIETDGKTKILLPEVVFIFMPLLFGLDGKYGFIDGLLLIFFYCVLLFYIYYINKQNVDIKLKIIKEEGISKKIIISITGVLIIMIVAHWIVLLANDLVDYFKISNFIVGIIVFSVGTNLPEIIITLTSWKRKALQLSVSHMISSAFTNVLILGIISIIAPITLNIGVEYYVLMFFVGTILMLFVWFYKTNKNLSRKEGVVLLSVYLLFVLSILYTQGI